HHVVDLGARDLTQLAVGDGLEAVAPARLDAPAGARLEGDDLQRPGVVLEREPQGSAQHVDRLVFLPVELEREPLAGLDRQDLAEIARGLGPDLFVSPGFFDTARHFRGPSVAHGVCTRSAQERGVSTEPPLFGRRLHSCAAYRPVTATPRRNRSEYNWHACRK